MKFLLLLTALEGALEFSNHLAPRAGIVGQTVSTTSGQVRGHAASNATSVSEYLGIPYGRTTGGKNRFAPPLRFSGNVTLNGTRFGFTCPQLGVPVTGVTGQSGFNSTNADITPVGLFLLANSSQNLTPMDEDCLILNIWTPSGGEAKKAVMILVHGGGFTTGSSSVSVYDGQDLASQQDVIVVTIKYFTLSLNPEHHPNTTPPFIIPPSTVDELAIKAYIQGAWATFVKDPVNGLKSFGGGWPTFDPNGDTLVRLGFEKGFENKTGTNLAPAGMYDGACVSLAQTVAPGTNSTGSGSGSGSGSGRGKTSAAM